MSARSQTVPQKAARASSRSSTGAQRRGACADMQEKLSAYRDDAGRKA